MRHSNEGAEGDSATPVYKEFRTRGPNMTAIDVCYLIAILGSIMGVVVIFGGFL